MAFVFRFIKDIKPEEEKPLPPSEHPKTALALAVTAVSLPLIILLSRVMKI
jgi:hypothetical protein